MFWLRNKENSFEYTLLFKGLKDSDKPAHPGSLARAFAACIHKVWKYSAAKKIKKTTIFLASARKRL